MPESPRGDHYREEARRVRELARKIGAPDIRQQMEQIAMQYYELAGVADRLAENR